METKNLIQKLSNDHKKVKPVESVPVQFLKWILISILCLLAGIGTLGLREDWQFLFKTPLLLLQNILLLISFISVGFCALNLARPGRLTIKIITLSLLTPIIMWGAVLLIMILTDSYQPQKAFKISFGCIKDILIIGMLPGAALFFFISRGVILKRFLSGLMSTLAFLMIGAWAVQFTCHNDDPLHIVIWHFLPIIVLALIGASIYLSLSKKL